MGNAAKTQERTSIQDYLITEEYITTNDISRDLIYEIQIEDNHLGPFLNTDLKDFLADANLYLEETMVKSIDDDKWVSVYNHPYFQRRKPALVSTKDLGTIAEEFLILREGKKEGPFSREQMEVMLTNHDVLSIDYVSIDKGFSWGKLFEVEGFDRRDKDNESLPTSPEGHIFTNSVYDADKALSLAEKHAGEKDAIVGLAYIGHLNEGKKKVHIDEGPKKEIDSKSDEVTSTKSLIKYIQNALFGVIVLSLIYFVVESRNAKELKEFNAPDTKAIIPETKSAPAPAPEVKKPTPINRAPAVKNIEVTQGRSVTRSNSSIRDAEFLKKKMDEGAIFEVPPEAIFDDATEAVELDPIRQRISKDTIDPELESIEDNIPNNELDEISRSLGPIDQFGNALDESHDADAYDQ